MRKRCQEVYATNLRGEEESYFFPKEEFQTSAQRRATDERSIEEIIDEEGFEAVSQWSQIYHHFQ